MVASDLAQLPGNSVQPSALRIHRACRTRLGISNPKGCQTIPGATEERVSPSLTCLLFSGSRAQDRVREKGDSARAQARRELDQEERSYGGHTRGGVWKTGPPKSGPDESSELRPEKSSHWFPPTETVPGQERLDPWIASGKIRRERVDRGPPLWRALSALEALRIGAPFESSPSGRVWVAGHSEGQPESSASARCPDHDLDGRKGLTGRVMPTPR